jgi:hypothetical protein
MNPQAVHYMINHLFLPPKLPQEDDSGDPSNQEALLLHLSESAKAFADGLSHLDHISAQASQAWRILQRMLESMHRIHRGTHLSMAELQRTIERMKVQGQLTLIVAIFYYSFGP